MKTTNRSTPTKKWSSVTASDGRWTRRRLKTTASESTTKASERFFSLHGRMSAFRRSRASVIIRARETNPRTRGGLTNAKALIFVFDSDCVDCLGSTSRHHPSEEWQSAQRQGHE